MSEFSVHRTADTIQALKYCLILDGERIAGGKPDYRGNNYLISWSTRETYGPVDQLKAENAKLRELLLDVWNDAMQFDGFWDYVNDNGEIYNEDQLPHYYDRMRELGMEVD